VQGGVLKMGHQFRVRNTIEAPQVADIAGTQFKG